MNQEYIGTYHQSHTDDYHNDGSLSDTDGYMGRISYGPLRGKHGSKRKMKRNYERRHYGTRIMTLGIRYYHSFMKYTQYIALAGLYGIALAAPVAIDKTGLPGSGVTVSSGVSSLKQMMISVISMMQDITAIIAVIGICIVGIMYIMSHGDEEKTGAAKKYMIAIGIGTLIAFSAWGMISIVDVIPNSFNL